LRSRRNVVTRHRRRSRTTRSLRRTAGTPSNPPVPGPHVGAGRACSRRVSRTGAGAARCTYGLLPWQLVCQWRGAMQTGRPSPPVPVARVRSRSPLLASSPLPARCGVATRVRPLLHGRPSPPGPLLLRGRAAPDPKRLRGPCWSHAAVATSSLAVSSSSSLSFHMPLTLISSISSSQALSLGMPRRTTSLPTYRSTLPGAPPT